MTDLLLGLFLRHWKYTKDFNNSKKKIIDKYICAHWKFRQNWRTLPPNFSDTKNIAQLSISNRSKFFILFFQFLFISLCFLLQPRVPTPSRNVLYTIPPPIKLTQWHALGREEQAKYYELARRERQLHMQMYPDWSSRTNATRGKKRKRKQEPNDGGTKSKHLQNLHNSFNCFCTHFSLLLKLNAKFIKSKSLCAN